MKGRQIIYSRAELAWIERNRTMPRREAHAAFQAKFARSDVLFEHYKSLCSRKGWLTGRTGRIEKGNVPANKGKKMPYNANSARTQFKKGQLPHNTRYLGHERVSKDGYVEISVDRPNPHTGYERTYVLKHVHLWEEQNGPVPEGHCLKSLDGNRQNTDPSNWEAIPRAVLPILSARYGMSYDQAEPDVKPVIMTTAKLKHAVNKIKSKRPHSKTESVPDA